MNTVTRLSFITGILLVGTACSSKGQTVNDETSMKHNSSKDLYATIQRLTSDKTCNTDEQCASIGIGARPCGGPEKYMIYSKPNTDEKKLTSAVDQYYLIQKLKNEKLKKLGICVVATPPEVECVKQQCQKVPTVRIGTSF